jgi:predicted O-methyltransferase YrrM
MKWYRIKSYLAFYFKAITKFNAQSPFLFDFISNVADVDKTYYIFDDIELQRKKLLKRNDYITVQDYGAGSSYSKSVEKKISDIASTALSQKSKCRLLFNAVVYYNCNNILELGTSLGISSAYLASANQQGQVITLEGDKNIASIAKEVHHALNLKNISIVTGVFQDTLPRLMHELPALNLIFIDGHHQEKPTLEYFAMVAPKITPDTVVIIDDIYWSEEMTRAWSSLRSMPEVTLSIDLFHVGIMFFKEGLSKENVHYIAYKYKPWRIGVFG